MYYVVHSVFPCNEFETVNNCGTFRWKEKLCLLIHVYGGDNVFAYCISYVTMMNQHLKSLFVSGREVATNKQTDVLLSCKPLPWCCFLKLKIKRINPKGKQKPGHV